jgi:tRNA (guanine-N7-)-methyltransferase
MESSYAVTHLMRAESVSAFHLLFPDPWPKRRHHRRRLFTAQFTDAIHRALETDGLFHIATDHADYFRSIENVIRMNSFFSTSKEAIQFPSTVFEERAASEGVPVQRLLLRKTSPVR